MAATLFVYKLRPLHDLRLTILFSIGLVSDDVTVLSVVKCWHCTTWSSVSSRVV